MASSLPRSSTLLTLGRHCLPRIRGQRLRAGRPFSIPSPSTSRMWRGSTTTCLPGAQLPAGSPPFQGPGSAATLLDAVNFYVTRFNLNLSEQDKADLVAFLNSL